MGVWKRGSTWYAEIRIGAVRRREAVGPRKADAEAVVAKWKEEIRQGRFPTLRRVKPILFRDHAKEVLEKHYSSKRAREWAKMIIESHLTPFFGETFLGAITPRMIDDYKSLRLTGQLNPKKARTPSNGTVNNERAVLSKIMTLAVKWERVAENPVRRVEKLETPNGRLRFLTHDEADNLIAHAPKHLKPVIVAALETGGRLSEVLGLRWDDIDMEHGILFFDQRNTKNARQREIPITPTLATTLRALPRSIRGDHVFIRYGKPMRDVRTGFEKARVGAELGKEVTFHTLRHTFASWYAQRGGDLNLLRDLLGHESGLAMTMRYAHLSPSYRKSAVPIMGRQPQIVQTGAAGSEGVGDPSALKSPSSESGGGKSRP